MPTVLRACHCCGLVHNVPQLGGGEEATCSRCGTALKTRAHARARSRTTAFALAGLVLFPLAIGLPILRVEQLGHQHATNVWQGVVELLAAGEWVVGLIVLVCSLVIPVLKLVAMLLLSQRRQRLGRRHRALTYRAVEWLGRWGMVDVLLVAVLVALVKLGSWVQVEPGPGLFAFTAMVMCSLFSTACFDPHSIWEEE